MPDVHRCEGCGASDPQAAPDGRWWCADCAADQASVTDGRPPLIVVGELGESGTNGPGVLVAGEWWSWAELGDAVAETQAGGRGVEVRLSGAPRSAGRPPTIPPSSGARVLEGAGPDAEDIPLWLASDEADAPVGEFGDVERAEAVALLAECLPPEERHPRPADQLAAACRRVRREVSAAGRWTAVAALAGWAGEPPADDDELWLAAALCIARPRRRRVQADLERCLEAMEPDDWLATVIELTRAGPGTPVDVETLLALSARCLDVDSGAVEPDIAPMIATVFSATVPLWRALGAVGPDGLLSDLGAWGLPVALALAWGGELEPGRATQREAGPV